VFVISKNLTRRHLDDNQRRMVAARIANMRQGERTDITQIGQGSISQGDAADSARSPNITLPGAKRLASAAPNESPPWR